MSTEDTPVQYGTVTATYFWDDASGINGDTGMPAGGEPMQKGLFSSPSWPLGTEGYIEYEGKTAEFFIGDRGPGEPSHDCDVLLDIDGKTFAELTGGTWDEESYVVSGGTGHIYDVEYYITKWGDGDGTEGAPHPFQQPENKCDSAVSPIPEEALQEEESEEADEKEEADKKEENAEEASEEESAKEESAKQEDSAEEKETESDEEDQESAAAGDEDEGSGVTAETAANDISGLQLTGADGALGGGGLLVLALIPAILLTLAFAWYRRPAGAHAGETDSDSKGLMAESSGKHSLGSLFDRLRGRKDEDA